jgi:hypothetical protein
MMHYDWYGPTGFGIGLIYWVIVSVLVAFFVTALVHDAQARRWVWLVADLMIPPVAVIRGFLVWIEKV